MPEYCVGMFFYALMYERVVHVFIKVRVDGINSWIRACNIEREGDSHIA